MLRFYKGRPTDHVVKFVAGKKRQEGPGKVFFVGPRTTIACVPTTDLPQPFAFTEITADGQQLMVQGELHLRLLVQRILGRADLTIDPRTNAYRSDDFSKVKEQSCHALQGFVRRQVQAATLQQSLGAVATLQRAVLAAIAAAAEPFERLGVEVVALFITQVAPDNLDLRRALEAEVRERLLAAADKAVSDRRMRAAESERELKTYEEETAVLLEQQRGRRIAARNANLIAEAKAESEATAKRLEPYQKMDPRTLFALGVREMSSSGKVGQVNFTPELLAAISRADGGEHAGSGKRER